MALETEEIGAGVIQVLWLFESFHYFDLDKQRLSLLNFVDLIQDLDQQRETLTRTRDRLMDTDLELGRSRRILRSMYMVALTNKLVLILIILLELGILAGLVYYKFFS